MSELLIRSHAPSDAEASAVVLKAAFGGEDEVLLVQALCARGELAMVLVAERGGELVGIVAFEAIAVVPDPGYPVWALAPMAVLPRAQRQGVGAALLAEGLARAQRAGVGFVVVLGEPDYYRRFGFAPELTHGLEAPWSGPYFMGLKLADVPTPIGAVHYPAPFFA